MGLCTTPELACEVTLQPVQRFPLDAAILFSDILTVPDAMGLGLHFIEGEGPRFARPVRSLEAIARLHNPDPETELRYVMDAVRMIRHELNGRLPLIGFSGSPWTLATYMVEGGSSKDFAHIKTMLFEHPRWVHQMLATTASAVTAYLNAQIAAGAQVVMLFDTWGGVLTPEYYKEFSLRYMAEILSGLTREQEGRRIPVILFTKNAGQWLDDIAATGCEAIGVDWTTDLKQARARLGSTTALQGNLDPAVLLSSPASIHKQVCSVLESYGDGNGHIFNLGHGIYPQTPPEHVEALLAAVHSESPLYHTLAPTGMPSVTA